MRSNSIIATVSRARELCFLNRGLLWRCAMEVQKIFDVHKLGFENSNVLREMFLSLDQIDRIVTDACNLLLVNCFLNLGYCTQKVSELKQW